MLVVNVTERALTPYLNVINSLLGLYMPEVCFVSCRHSKKDRRAMMWLPV